MSAISTATSYPSNVSQFLTSNSSGWSRAGWGRARSGAAQGGSGHDRGPVTHVDLSDRVKRLLARASNDQGVADQLKDFVEQRRSNGTNTPAQAALPSSGQDTSTDVSQAFEQLSGGAQIAQGDQPVQTAQNFASSLEAGGYTISAAGSASDGSYQIEIEGPDGTGFLDSRLGTSNELSAFSNLGPGTAAQEYQSDNKEYITFSQSEAAATSVTASSDAGTVSATSAATKTGFVTFVVDFSTGAISMAQTEQTSVATQVQIRSPGSTFSTLA
jgi:hypothetical protein